MCWPAARCELGGHQHGLTNYSLIQMLTTPSTDQFRAGDLWRWHSGTVYRVHSAWKGFVMLRRESGEGWRSRLEPITATAGFTRVQWGGRG